MYVCMSVAILAQAILALVRPQPVKATPCDNGPPSSLPPPFPPLHSHGDREWLASSSRRSATRRAGTSLVASTSSTS